MQDENDPDKYIFSPWGSVPARDEENQPDNSIPTNAEIAAAIEELAEIVAGMEG